MTYSEIFNEASRTDIFTGRQLERVVFTMRRKGLPSRSGRTTLDGPGSPRGRVGNVNEVEGGYTVVAMFDAAQVRKWCMRKMDEAATPNPETPAQ